MLETAHYRYPMTAAEREEARSLSAEGNGVREIARRFDRAPSTISRLLRGGRAGVRRSRPAPPLQAGRRPTPVSHQELRDVKRRVARIEAALLRLGAALQRAQ